jgi:hypothetical protein
MDEKQTPRKTTRKMGNINLHNEKCKPVSKRILTQKQ